MLRDLLQRLDQVLRDSRREELRWTFPRRLTSLHSFAILSVKRSFSAQDMDVKQLSASLTVLLGLLRLLLPHLKLFSDSLIAPQMMSRRLYASSGTTSASAPMAFSASPRYVSFCRQERR